MSRFDVLLTEDNLLFGTLLKTALEQWGGRVRVARTVQEATRALESRRPDLLVLEEALPDGAADDVAQRAMDLHDDQIPCIVLSHLPRLAASSSPTVTVLVKPIDMEAFQRQVAQALGVTLGMRQVGKSLSKHAFGSSQRAFAVPPMDSARSNAQTPSGAAGQRA